MQAVEEQRDGAITSGFKLRRDLAATQAALKVARAQADKLQEQISKSALRLREARATVKPLRIRVSALAGASHGIETAYWKTKAELTHFRNQLAEKNQELDRLKKRLATIKRSQKNTPSWNSTAFFAQQQYRAALNWFRNVTNKKSLEDSSSSQHVVSLDAYLTAGASAQNLTEIPGIPSDLLVLIGVEPQVQAAPAREPERYSP